MLPQIPMLLPTNSSQPYMPPIKLQDPYNQIKLEQLYPIQPPYNIKFEDQDWPLCKTQPLFPAPKLQPCCPQPHTHYSAPASLLLSRFPHPPMVREKKCTNLPKYLFNLMLESIASIETSIMNGRHTRWINSIRKKYFTKDCRGKGQSRSRFSLMEFLQNQFSDSEERRQWKSRHRGFLQRKLAEERFRNILTNAAIPIFNKAHYLYYCKLYEWRLNSPNLLGHLT